MEEENNFLSVLWPEELIKLKMKKKYFTVGTKNLRKNILNINLTYMIKMNFYLLIVRQIAKKMLFFIPENYKFVLK